MNWAHSNMNEVCINSA